MVVIVNDELERPWKKAVVICFKLEENHKTPQAG